ncbi:MAG: membrane protein insertion efficiency factor YidD [Bacilli bacterium]|nr:membrane protein insertion efficiency factor YidD [Bacilli bacterium]
MHKCKNKFAVKLIKSYQKNKSLIGVGHCKFYPTCSDYALETYKKFNFFYATILVGFRILRCNAFAKRRYYPVKLTRKEKQERSYLKKLKAYLNDDFIDYLLSVAKENITEEELYRYIYDYYYLPKYAHFSKIPPHDTIYASRFIVTNKPFNNTNKINNLKNFDEYLKITNELFDKKIIDKTYKVSSLENTTDSIISIDSISINEYLLNLDINKGIILINNYDGDINYLDFEEIYFNTNKIKVFKKIIEDKDKLIVKTKNINILEYLEYVDHSINIYDNIDDINYFYNVNKRLGK